MLLVKTPLNLVEHWHMTTVLGYYTFLFIINERHIEPLAYYFEHRIPQKTLRLIVYAQVGLLAEEKRSIYFKSGYTINKPVKIPVAYTLNRAETAMSNGVMSNE